MQPEVLTEHKQYQFDVNVPLQSQGATAAGRDRLMRWWVVSGDSSRLPVSTRHRADMYELRYRKGDLLMVAYSGPLNKGDPKAVVDALKDGARKMMRDWLDRNDIPVGAVLVQGLEETADYRVRFRVEAVVTGRRPVSLMVPPWGDDWWKEMMPDGT